MLFTVKSIEKLDDTRYKILHEDLYQELFSDLIKLKA